MKTIFILAFSLLVFSFSKSGTSVCNDKIHWKRLHTEEEVRNEIDKRIFAGSDFDVDYKILANQKHEWLSTEGDSLILFHSPYIATHPFSFVSRKWMCKFHFTNKKLVNYEVEKGLLGP